MTAGLLLAAGGGLRFGMPKALARFRGEPLVHQAIRALRDGGCDPIVVVIGASAAEVAAQLPEDVAAVENPEWSTGMGSSLRAGLDALAEFAVDSAVVLTVDTPGVTAAAVARLAAHAAPDALARASYDGAPGHPVLLGRDHWPGVAALAVGDTGARAYLKTHRPVDVPCGDIADGADADHPADLTRLGGTVDAYGELALAHLAKVAEHNSDALDDAADLVLACIRADGLVLTSGAGHSLAAVAETFFRAGGLACVRPLVHDDLQVFGGARRATAAERRTGLAAEVFAAVPRTGHEVLFIFSNSGVNPFPVELAQTALDAGCPVVAVTSPTSSVGATRRAGGLLAQHATILLDTLTGPGDVAYPAESPVTASLSTMCNAFLWNLMLARLHDRATAEAVDLPRWRSSNVEGGDTANAALLDKYGERVPNLG